MCDEPSSEDPHEWPEDITKWPVSWGLTLVGWGGATPYNTGAVDSVGPPQHHSQGPDLCPACPTRLVSVSRESGQEN